LWILLSTDPNPKIEAFAIPKLPMAICYTRTSMAAQSHPFKDCLD